MARGSCNPRITWLRTSNCVTLLSPRSHDNHSAGMIANPRVNSRRSQGRIRQCMNPSMTTWPAKVPVMVLL